MNHDTLPGQPEQNDTSAEYAAAIAQLTGNVDALLDQGDPRITHSDGFASAYTVNLQETSQGGHTVTQRSAVRHYTRTTDGAGRRSYEIDGHALADMYPDPTEGIAPTSRNRTRWTVAKDGGIIMEVMGQSSQSESDPGTDKRLDAEGVRQRAGDINETTHVFDPETQELRARRKTGVEIIPKRRSTTDRVLGVIATLGS